MPVLDFTEIPTAASGMDRDQFELFAREVTVLLGFSIVIGPDRGPDAGRDLVVEELRTGVVGETRIRWLVSCKHKAHSGVSVKPEDEPDIHDRVRTHGCNGFLGFYSTIPSSGLAAKLNAVDLPFEVQVFDPERIERCLLASAHGVELAKRFFPISQAKWKRDHRTAAKLFAEEPELTCASCRKSLLTPTPHGIVVVWTTPLDEEDCSHKRTERVYWCCKGLCDHNLHDLYYQKGMIDGWKDLSDLLIPLEYIRWIMGVINKAHRGDTYSNEALENVKELLLNLFPLVARDLTSDEMKRIDRLSSLPSFLGGWDYDGE